MGRGFESSLVQAYGIAMGVVSSLILATHWSLQIWETWELQTIGNLSLFSLFLVVGGSLLTAYSVGIHGGFFVALSYIVSSVMMGTELALGFYLRHRRPARDRSLQGGPCSQPLSIAEVRASRNSSQT